MKKLVLFLMFFIIIPNNVLANDAIKFIDVKIGKTYAIFEKIDISGDSNLALFQNDDLGNELLVFDGEKIYAGKTFGVNNRIDIFNSENQYITSIPSNGSVLIGQRSDYESVIKVGGKKYRGYISFIDDSMGLKIINHIDLEEYLKGVVPREIPALSPIEAIKAQAVAARSYAYAGLAKHSKEGYNLCDTTHCQVYGGFSDENIYTSEAVEQTREMVAKHNNSVANTVFHSSSGGYTESSESIWGSKLSYLKGKEDPFSLDSKHSIWSVEISKDLLCSALNENGYEISEIKDIRIIETLESGRVKNITINESNENLNISGDKFRSLIGTNTLKSTLFKIQGQALPHRNDIYAKGKDQVSPILGIQVLNDKGIIFQNNARYSIIGKDNELRTVEIASPTLNSSSISVSGSGFGHGVGMSQYGAIEMAKQGYGYIDILKYYYTGVEITKIN